MIARDVVAGSCRVVGAGKATRRLIRVALLSDRLELDGPLRPLAVRVAAGALLRRLRARGGGGAGTAAPPSTVRAASASALGGSDPEPAPPTVQVFLPLLQR